MPDDAILLGFVVASLVVLVTPGPGVFYVVARSLAQGRRAGLVSALGLSAGVFFHVAAATIGISAILLTSATAFNLVKILGAGYLIYLGLKTIFAGRPAAGMTAPPPATLHRLFVDGVIVSLFNPKIAVFFLAFLPQFVGADQPAAPQQVLFLGTIYAGLAFLTDGTYALLASGLRRWFDSRVLQSPLVKYLSGSVFIGLGINTTLAGRQP